ncbi:MAG: lipopolysaccharide heptosyltransferase II, partial [Chlamydiales bacterium]|nr:lipopolysaccharide heptosyltransferase II [Chlamydiales bacterium]
PICELLKEDESIDELFCFTKPQNDFLRRETKRNIIKKIIQGKYDLGILLTNSFSSAWWFWQGGVKRRIGFSGHMRSWLLTDSLTPLSQREHQVLSYKRLLEPLGIALSDTKPRLYVSSKEVSEARELLDQRGYHSGKKLVGMNPGAAYGSAKCWPSERFRALALRLVQEEDVYVVVFGDASAELLVKQICQGLPESVMNLAGVTSLRELCCIIKCCDVVVTNDSGPMHIAAAFDVPLIAFFGSTDKYKTGPYGRLEAVVDKEVSCSPCFKRICPIDFRCMKQIEVDEVFDRVHTILKSHV